MVSKGKGKGKDKGWLQWNSTDRMPATCCGWRKSTKSVLFAGRLLPRSASSPGPGPGPGPTTLRRSNLTFSWCVLEHDS